MSACESPLPHAGKNKRPDKMKPTNHATKSNRHVSRRRFVTNLAAAAAGTAALATQSWAEDAARADQQSPGDSVDVLVVGGGTAGAIAAIQAARAGAAQFGLVQASCMAMGQAAGAAAALAANAGLTPSQAPL